MKHIYLFNETSHGTVYGIGTYIRQLVSCLKDEEDTAFSIVHLHAGEKEFKTEKTPEGYSIYYFPCVQGETMTFNDRYYRNILLILSPFININIKNHQNEQLYFHLNSSSQYPLIKLLKEKYPFSRILYTIHIQDWSFRKSASYSEKKTNKEKKRISTLFEEEKRLYCEVDRIICLSKHTEKSLINEFHIPEDKISLIHNGLEDEAIFLSDEEKTGLKKQLFFSGQSRIILFAGRLVKMKGVDILIDAFKLLLKDMPDSQLVIAGDGNFYTYLEKCKGLWQKVTFAGRLNKDELYQFYRIADMGVVCSVYEEFGYVALEMMMHRLPVIASDTGGLAEIVDDMVTGLKVPVRTVKKEHRADLAVLCDRMKWMLEHPEEAKELGQQARKKFLKLYELSAWENKMLEIYNKP